MRKMIVAVLAVLMSFQTAAGAFELKEISPDASMLNDRNINIEKDIEYVQNIADKYSPFYVVEQVEQTDISDIDRFYTDLSRSLTLTEFDNGEIDLKLDMALDKELRRNLNLFKVLGGFGGYKVEFEPVVYFNIYRNISLVGGYSCYTKTFENTETAAKSYIWSVENLTKEILRQNTRDKITELMYELDEFISNDSALKIFLLKDGKIDSLWECDEI